MAIFLPPLAVLSVGKPGSFLINILLCFCGVVPGVIHAVMIVSEYNAEKRTDRIVNTIKKSQPDTGQQADKRELFPKLVLGAIGFYAVTLAVSKIFPGSEQSTYQETPQALPAPASGNKLRASSSIQTHNVEQQNHEFTQGAAKPPEPDAKIMEVTAIGKPTPDNALPVGKSNSSVTSDGPSKKTVSVEESKQEAVRRYPDLGVAGSRFNREFVARYQRYQRENTSFLENASWPIRLAEEIATSIGANETKR